MREIVGYRMCKNCLTEFTINSITAHKKIFCNVKCCDEYHTSKVPEEERYKPKPNDTGTCKHCENVFEKKVNVKRDFCGVKCRKEFEAIQRKTLNKEMECEYCEATFFVNELSVRLYCSTKCRTLGVRLKQQAKKESEENNLEIIVERRVVEIFSKAKEIQPLTTFGVSSSAWDIGGFGEAIKRKVRDRDNHQCRVCESEMSLEIHHILKRSLGGAHDLDNLITLCVKCHRAIETGDEIHAIDKCYKNAKAIGGIEEKGFQDAMDGRRIEFILNKVFNTVSNINSVEYSEILVELSEAIETIEDRNREVEKQWKL